MKLSVVSTLYRSSSHLAEFVARASQAAGQVSGDYEIILVNDGSPDDSLERAIAMVNADPHITVVDLSRNFGHHKAMMAGLRHAQGDLVFLIDSDLEEPPEVLPRFLLTMQGEQADVAYGVQESRKGGVFERFNGWLFYKLFAVLSHVNVPRNVLTARLMTRRYVQSLLEHREREVFLLGLWTITGYKQTPVVVAKQSLSPTTYSFLRRMVVLANAVTSFSSLPLVMIFAFGLFVSLASFVYAFVMVLRKVVWGVTLSGWTSLFVSMWFLGGVITMSLGVIGVYLAKLFSEVKQRPYVIEREVYLHPRVEGEPSEP